MVFVDSAGRRHLLFGEGGGARVAEALGTALLGQVHELPVPDLFRPDAAVQHGLVHDRPQGQRRRVVPGQDLLAAEPELDELAGFLLAFQQVTPLPLAALRLPADTIAALARVGLSDLADAPVGSLTSKELRLMELARALAPRPKLLLMDEPCSSLDPIATARLEETIAELAATSTEPLRSTAVASNVYVPTGRVGATA